MNKLYVLFPVRKTIFKSWCQLYINHTLIKYKANLANDLTMDWMFMPPTKKRKKSYVEILTPCSSIKRWGLGEMIKSWKWRHHDWDYCFCKRDPRKLPFPFHYMKTQRKDSPLWTWKQAFTRYEICQCLNLGLSTSKLSEINFCYLLLTQAMVFCYSSLNILRMILKLIWKSKGQNIQEHFENEK